MKKLFTFLLTTLMVVGSIGSVCYAATSQFSQTNNKAMDFSEFTYEAVAETYSYGTVRWTSQTKLIAISPTSDSVYFAYDSDEQCYHIGATYDDPYIQFRITNCAVDKFGNICDIIVTVDNMSKTSLDISDSRFASFEWNDYGNAYFGLDEGKRTDDDLVRNVINVYKSTPINSTTTNIISFKFETLATASDFTMVYVLTGTDTPVNQYDMEQYGEMGIEGTQTSMYDIDYSTASSAFADAEDWNCCEAFYVYNDASIFFDEDTTSEARNLAISVNGHPGVRTPYGSKAYSYDWTDVYATATIISDIEEDSSYKMHYSGFGCGLYYCFVNEIAAEVTSPVIEVDKTIVNEEETFTYKITQSIPSNYYSYLIRSQIGLQDTEAITKVVIKDDLSKLFDSSIDCSQILNMPTVNQVVVTNALSGEDVTSDFTIAVSGTTVSATSKDINDPDFYGQTYVVSFPVSFKEGTGLYVSSNGTTVNRIKDMAQTDYGIKVASSNQVVTSLKYLCELSVSVDHGSVDAVKVNGNDNKATVLIDNDCNYVAAFTIDSDYDFVKATLDGQDVSDEVVWSDNQGQYTLTDAAVREDIAHELIVVTKMKTGNVITHYVDTEGNDLADRIEDEGTIYSEHVSHLIEIDKYELYEEPYAVDVDYQLSEDNDVTVNYIDGTIDVYYVYVKGNGKVITHYIDTEGNDLADQIEDVGTIDSEHVSSKIDIEDYELYEEPYAVDVDYQLSEDYQVTVNYIDGAIDVYYVYTKSNGKVITHYIDKDGNDLADPIEDEGKINTPHVSGKIDIEGYELYEEPYAVDVDYQLSEDDYVTVTYIDGTIDVYYVYAKNNGVVVYEVEQEGNYTTSSFEEAFGLTVVEE